MAEARKVRDIMTPSPATCDSSTSLFEIATVMRDRDIGNVIVTGEGGDLRGVITDRDIVVRAVAEDRDPRETDVGSIVSGDVVTISPDDADEDAARLMRERAVKRVPVVDDGALVGVLSLGDLAIARDPDSALADISEAPSNR